MIKIRIWYCLFVTVLGISVMGAQTGKKVNDSTKNVSINVLPVVYYLPETGLGYGIVGLSTFRMPGEKATTRPSSFQLSLTLTTKKQFLLFVPYELYFDEEKWRFKGELGFYKYFYNYFGKGIMSDREDKETYAVDFPRFRLAAYREVLPGFSVGLGYEFDGYHVLEPEPNGLLDNSNEIGKEGGTISNLGLSALYDTRDHIFYPTKGWYLEGALYQGAKFLGADFSYTKFELDARYFQKIKGEQVLASNFFLGTRSANSPFQDLNYLGTKRTRGFDNRRFLDNTELSLTSEYRFPIWRRFKGAVFGSASTVSPSLNDIFNTSYKAAFGGGIRYVINRKEGTRVRIDYGRSSEGGQIYFTINEAF